MDGRRRADRSPRLSRLVRLPLSAVRFSPRLAADGAAPADTRFEVPYTVRGPATSAGVRALRFEVSYDESAVWRPVADFGAGRLVLDHPRGVNSVSLRVHLTDAPRTTGRQSGTAGAAQSGAGQVSGAAVGRAASTDG